MAKRKRHSTAGHEPAHAVAQHAETKGSATEHAEPAKRAKSDWFRRFALLASNHLGSHWAFLTAVLVVVAWAVSGPFFDFSEDWQLVINTGTTIITFLMVFLIQTTQNRDSRALHLKLDELIRASKARNVFADLEDASDEELAAFQREFQKLRQSGMELDAAAEAARETSRGERRRD